jgi:hypothetical protein
MEARYSTVSSDQNRTNFVQENVAQKRAATRAIARQRAISRTYGIFALIEGGAGLLTAIGLQFWVQEIMIKRVETYGRTYMKVYDLESIGLMLLGAVFFFVAIAGVGFIKRERWAVYCTLICGILTFVISVAAILIRHQLLSDIDPSMPFSIPAMIIKFMFAIVISAPLIIPPLLPPIMSSTEPPRRLKHSRPHIG